MSHLGQSRPNWAVRAMSGLSPLATELRTSLVVRFVPLPDIQEPGERGTARAASSGRSSLGWKDERHRIHVPLFAEARSIAPNSVSLKRQPSASRLALA
jgi:hypothetical protein